ncbi:NAD(P)H-binding protein [Corynebacterium halotolerans]|uniref:NAD-dependent epimerase/dehydratase n=1 Tax=Corynebacterium halotolerans YIM 70093 = DSM 44683 TaxID=1121362 RepID=M1NUU8_9CORY|nr:NAD(P)H-binding protein [Corynebacterium halotolerans]AGF73272.1 NAD-dependent epimerase/dehydratase [Corynebacterium halotolerans YIM 70093 = DSM 44683]
MTTVAIIGATGSNGRLTVDAALDRGLTVRATSRSAGRAHRILGEREGLEILEAEGTDPAAVTAVVDGVDAVILTHGKDSSPEEVNYGVIAAVVKAFKQLGERRPHVSLMSAISVTQNIPAWAEVLEWRRRGERLLRASGLPYTIVRPGWFDGHSPGDDRAILEQGDRTPLNARRGVSRRHIAKTLVESVLTDSANFRTVELFSGPGESVDDWDLLFNRADVDPAGSIDGVHDLIGLPLEHEPTRFLTDLDRLRRSGP